MIRGEGKCFSAGIDLTFLGDLAQFDDKGLGAKVRILAGKIQSIMNRIEDIEKPVIAVIHGFCGGLAMEMAMACDFRLASTSATFGVPEMIMGLVPDCGGTTRLTRTLGIARAKELVMLGEMIDAAKAERFGLVTRVFPEDAFESESQAFVEKVLNRPPLGIGLAKRLIDIGAGTDRATFMNLEATIQSILITAKDFPQTLMEGVQKIKAGQNK